MWWIWVVSGGVLLAAEIFTPGSFFLFFLGLAAIITGVLELSVGEMESWLSWTLFAVIATVSLLLFRSKLRIALQRSAQEAPPEVVGESGVVVETAIAAGAIGSIELRGTNWRARNVSNSVLTPGTRVVVKAISGLQVDVVAQ